MAMSLVPTVRPRAEVLVDEAGADDGLLSVGDLCRMFEESEEASSESRREAERDRDYYDNKQLTAEQKAVLAKRGQPEVIVNRIKRKIDYLVGLEKQQRTMPRSLPRTPVHEQDAQAVTDALRYVADAQNYHAIRSAVWRNMLIEGAAACGVSVEPKRPDPQDLMVSTALGGLQQKFDVKLRFYAWDRFFADPHSSRLDYSDANYLGVVLWMDRDDALALYPDAADIFESTLASGHYSETYDDTPKWKVWADRKRKRVRVVQIWVKRNDEWYFAEFTKGGILKAGPSPHVDEHGKTECEIVAQSAYCDRENNRYGVVREMVSPQDEINKRRSKSLHLLNSNQTTMEEGAVQDVEGFRREKAKPDGVMVVNAGFFDKIKTETRTDMAQGHLGLLQEAKNEIDLMGPNASMQGETGDTASGRAIMASQQGGMIQMGDLLDNLRTFDRNVFRAIWARVRQHWTAPMWIRITDDERNVRFAAVNGQIDPVTQRPGPVLAHLDADIIIDDAPDTVAPAIEQFNTLVELKKFDANNEIPFRAIIEAAPNLRNKDKVLEYIDQQGQQAEQAQAGPPPALLALQAEMELQQKKQEAELLLQREKMMGELALKRELGLLEAENERVIALAKARAQAEAQREAAMIRAAQSQPERTMQ